MKKVFRNFLISTIIIYFVLSIGVTIFNFIVYYNELSSLDAISNSNLHAETIEIPSNLDISEFFTIEYLHGKSEILYQNLKPTQNKKHSIYRKAFRMFLLKFKDKL